LADAFISGFDAKFTYNFWRPWTAIQNAAAIGHPELQDTTWFSLIPTPAHPEYTANHAIQSGAITTVLEAFYGRTVPPVTLTSPTTPSFSVTYTQPDDFRILFGTARIYGGLHYRNSIEKGWHQGKQIARNAIKHAYRQNDEDDRDDDE